MHELTYLCHCVSCYRNHSGHYPADIYISAIEFLCRKVLAAGPVSGEAGCAGGDGGDGQDLQ